MRKVSDIVHHRSFVFYGRSGTGKTTIASTFPKPLLLLDVNDRGTESIEDVKDVMVRDIDDWEDFEHTYWWLKKNPGKYKTVVVDTVSQLQQRCVEHVLRHKKKKDLANAGDWGTMTKQEWGQVAQLMKSWLVTFRDLPLEVVFIAQDRVFNFDDDADDSNNALAPEVGPRLTPSVASVLNAAVNVIGNTFIRIHQYEREVKGKKVKKKQVEYCLRVGPNPIYVTKLRKPREVQVPSFLIDPDYDSIIDTIKGD